MATARQQAIQTIATTVHYLNRIEFKGLEFKDMFGCNVFNENAQRTCLPKPVFKALQ